MKNRPRWYSCLLLGLVLLLVSLITGCTSSYTQEELDAACDEAYAEGYDIGYAEGHANGKAEGYTEGYDVGYDKGYNTRLGRSKLSEKEAGELKVHFIDVGQGQDGRQQAVSVRLTETQVDDDSGDGGDGP